jgi:hypothetical protein
MVDYKSDPALAARSWNFLETLSKVRPDPARRPGARSFQPLLLLPHPCLRRGGGGGGGGGSSDGAGRAGRVPGAVPAGLRPRGRPCRHIRRRGPADAA